MIAPMTSKQVILWYLRTLPIREKVFAPVDMSPMVPMRGEGSAPVDMSPMVPIREKGSAPVDMSPMVPMKFAWRRKGLMPI